MSSKKILEKIEDTADTLEGQARRFGVKADGYGLCNTCTNIRIIKTTYGNDFAECHAIYIGERNYRPRKEDPITECSHYWNKNWERFNELADKATLIDPNKIKPGFKKII